MSFEKLFRKMAGFKTLKDRTTPPSDSGSAEREGADRGPDRNGLTGKYQRRTKRPLPRDLPPRPEATLQNGIVEEALRRLIG